MLLNFKRDIDIVYSKDELKSLRKSLGNLLDNKRKGWSLIKKNMMKLIVIVKN